MPSGGCAGGPGQPGWGGSGTAWLGRAPRASVREGAGTGGDDKQVGGITTPISQIRGPKQFLFLCSLSWGSKPMSRRGTSQSHQKGAILVIPANLQEAGLGFAEASVGLSVLLGNSGHDGQVSKVLAVSSSPQGLALPQPAGLRLPPLPRHCPTCLSGVASVSSPCSQVCPAACPGAQQLRHPVTPFSHFLKLLPSLNQTRNQDPSLSGSQAPEEAEPAALPQRGQSMDAGTQAV